VCVLRNLFYCSLQVAFIRFVPLRILINSCFSTSKQRTKIQNTASGVLFRHTVHTSFGTSVQHVYKQLDSLMILIDNNKNAQALKHNS
jgi:hypothetical protein